MKFVKNLFLPVLLSAVFSCNNSSTKTDNTIDKKSSMSDSVKNPAAKNNATNPAGENTRSVTAQFVEFSLGDISHFIFRDKEGKSWDFSDNKDTTHAFAVELPRNKANETNQGWSSVKNLQGKWFDIKYVYRNGRELTNGLMDSVAVILEAKPKE